MKIQDSQHGVRLLDDLSDPALWELTTSDGAKARVSTSVSGGRSFLRIDYEFSGAGYVGIRRRLPISLPPNYAFAFDVKGAGLPNNLELKFIDDSGENVWWARWAHHTLPAKATTMRAKKRHVWYAWGPNREPITDVAQLEFCLAASAGGSGSIELSTLTMCELPISQGIEDAPITVTASSGQESASAVLDHNSAEIWHSDTADEHQELTFDFGGARELGGIVIDWGTALDEQVLSAVRRGVRSSDATARRNNDTANRLAVLVPHESGRGWKQVYETNAAPHTRTYVYLPETETAQLKLVFSESNRGCGYGIRSVEFKPIGFSKTANDLWSVVAKNAPHGCYPDYFNGRQTFWTVVSQPHGEHKALFSEHGSVEVDRLGFTIEPFLRIGADFLGWANAEFRQSLADGCLPIPSVTRVYRNCELTITTVAGLTDPPKPRVAGKPKSKSRRVPSVARSGVTYLRYRIKNTSGERLTGRLFAAIRPFQVNPPWQFLNAPGGFTPIRSIGWDRGFVRVNDDKVVIPFTSPSPFGATTLDGGDISAHLEYNVFPASTHAEHADGFASGALAFLVDVEPGAEQEVYLAVTDRDNRKRVGKPERGFEEGLDTWRRKLARVKVDLPGQIGAEMADTLKAQVAYIFANSKKQAFQPGARCYARTWIRDSALTSSALLEWGYGKEVAAFIRWFAPFQFDNGKIPCCVDARGSDAVPEHDSAGEFIYLVAEYLRYTGDRKLASEMLPRVVRAVEYMEALRATKLTPEFDAPDKLHLRGLMPESISHEGYSDKPAYSYWDDLWALRGYKDAVYLASELASGEVDRLSGLAAAFKADLFASIRRAMAFHDIDYIPGAADRGDFDATSTTMALDPVCEQVALAPELEATFEKYWQFFTQRRDGAAEWDGYTPYEWRSVGAFVRLGQRERAHALLDWFMSHRRPSGFRHWAEVVFKHPYTAKFVGDAPHTWVGSDYLRSVRALFVYEREEKDASVLVVGAGLTKAWLEEGFHLPRLRTRFGSISLTSTTKQVNRIHLMVAGKVQSVVKLALPSGFSGVLVGKRKLTPDDRGEVVLNLPARLTLISEPVS